MADALLYGWQLHIVTIILAQIIVVARGQRHLHILIGKHYLSLKPCLREDLLLDRELVCATGALLDYVKETQKTDGGRKMLMSYGQSAPTPSAV